MSFKTISTAVKISIRYYADDLKNQEICILPLKHGKIHFYVNEKSVSISIRSD